MTRLPKGAGADAGAAPEEAVGDVRTAAPGVGPEWVEIARISGAHGLRGDVILRAFTDDAMEVGNLGDLTDRATGRTFDIVSLRPGPKGVVARLAGIADRTAAEGLKGIVLCVPADRLPEPDDDEWYYTDLIGLVAVSTDGAWLGEVVAVQDFGAGDLLEIRPPTGRKTFFVPFTQDYVPAVHMDDGKVLIEPVPGLLPDDLTATAEGEAPEDGASDGGHAP